MNNEPQNQSILQNDYDKEMLSIILDMRIKLPKAWVNSLKSKKNSHLMKWIESKIPLLSDKKYSVVTKLYWILHDIMDYPYCPFYDGNPCELDYDMNRL